jgi:hypothetical protein
MAEAADPVAVLANIPAPPRTGSDWKAFVETMDNLRYSEWPVDLERARLWYEPHLDRIHEDAETRRADLIQLEQIASGYSSRERFLRRTEAAHAEGHGRLRHEAAEEGIRFAGMANGDRNADAVQPRR